MQAELSQPASRGFAVDGHVSRFLAGAILPLNYWRGIPAWFLAARKNHNVSRGLGCAEWREARVRSLKHQWSSHWRMPLTRTVLSTATAPTPVNGHPGLDTIRHGGGAVPPLQGGSPPHPTRLRP